MVFLPSEVAHGFAEVFGAADVIVLHSAPRAIGYVAGGVEGVLAAMLDALSDRTVVVPTFTTTRTDPATWRNPPAPAERWDAIRDELPLFDPALSPPRGMGRLAEIVWRLPGALRSSHPVESIAAYGPRAESIVRPHPIDDPMGPRSPWARLVAIDARVVMLGVGLERCSLLHHVERMAEVPYLESSAYGMPVEIDGARAWIEVTSGNNCSEGFPALEPELHARFALERLAVGHAVTAVASARALFDIGLDVLSRDPLALLCSDPTCSFCTAARRGDIPVVER